MLCLAFVHLARITLLTLAFSPGLDCKTVRIFAYSSTREQSNNSSGTRLKTESETGETRFKYVFFFCLARHAWPISLLIWGKKTDCFAVQPWLNVLYYTDRMLIGNMLEKRKEASSCKEKSGLKSSRFLFPLIWKVKRSLKIAQVTYFEKV